MSRLITEQQERAFKLCHHDFEGLEQQETAVRMGISQQAVSRLLAGVEKVMPEFFPILTKQEAKCYHYLTVEGWTPQEIADSLDISVNAVYKTCRRCRDKGLPFAGAHGKMLRYDESMDNEITETF